MRAPILRLLAALALAAAPAARAAEVAVLKSADSAAWRPTLDALRRGLAGQTVLEYELGNDRAEGQRVMLGLKGRPVIYVALGPLAAELVRETAPDAHLIFAMVPDPGKLGLLGPANVTGVSLTLPAKNQLAAFRMVNPRAVRIGVLYSPDGAGKLVQDAVKAAPVVRLQVMERPVANEQEVAEALRSLFKGSQAVDALWVPLDPLLMSDAVRRLLLSEAAKASRPVYASDASLVGEGALVSCAPDYASIGDQLADLANRIAGGETGTRIEMLIPRTELIVNRKVADKLKLDIPADALNAASKVY